MNPLELALLQPIFNYVLSLVEEKFGSRVTELEAKISQLLAAHEAASGAPQEPAV